ncbi:MAG TPA: FliG C-terminal domain-containing protein [Bacteriovoracaceae bacterium]|nr:FliG C-terminal domain-containing protein [Bacteriovoracaceae bacterium]
MTQKNPENGIFINGKKQVIELLQRMDGPDKARLLKNLRVRNPILAKELTESCISFESLWDLDDQALKTVLSQSQPAVLGLALSLVHVKNQRKALSLVSREMAMKAYDIMQKDLSGSRNECHRAQNKILELAISLHRNRVIQFY